MTIFREIEKFKSSVIDSMERMDRDTAEYRTQSDKLAAITLIMRFIKEDGSWATAKAKERIMYTLINGYAAASTQFQCSTASLKASMWQFSEKLKTIFGYPEIDILNLIDTNPNEGMYLFSLQTRGRGKIEELFPCELHQRLPQDCGFGKLDKHKFLSCMRMLKSITLPVLSERLNDADDSTLSSIFYILASSGHRFVAYRVALYQFLVGEISEDELMSKLKLTQNKEELSDDAIKSIE